MTGVSFTNAWVIETFRASAGIVPAPYDDPHPPPMVIRHTVGARTGRAHVVPMRAMPDGDRWYVFGSAHGAERHPAWFHNLVAYPDFDLEIGIHVIPVRATVAVGSERATVFDRQAARFPIFREYRDRLAREIPVVRLERRSV